MDFYFTPACEQCREVEESILPQLREVFSGRIRIRKHNLYDPDEFEAARRLLDELNVAGEDNVFCVVDRQIYLGGARRICDELFQTVDERFRSGSDAGRYDRTGAAAGQQSAPWALKGSFRLSLLAILAAGLADGLNPCAFATVVFLVSLLLTGGRRKKGILLVGVGFCTAVYLTYFLIGLGFFQVFRMSGMRPWLGKTVNGVLIAALIVMAALSFRDALKYRRTGRAEDLTLKLPERVRGFIRDFTHKNFKVHVGRELARRRFVSDSEQPSQAKALHGTWTTVAALPPNSICAGLCHFFGSFFLGFVVTVLESICTGQLYVPALACMARMSALRIQAILYLALYNFLFILPLIAVFVSAYLGASSLALAAWSRKNVFLEKCALGGIFLFLAAVLFWTG